MYILPPILPGCDSLHHEYTAFAYTDYHPFLAQDVYLGSDSAISGREARVTGFRYTQGCSWAFSSWVLSEIHNMHFSSFPGPVRYIILQTALLSRLRHSIRKVSASAPGGREYPDLKRKHIIHRERGRDREGPWTHKYTSTLAHSFDRTCTRLKIMNTHTHRVVGEY